MVLTRETKVDICAIPIIDLHRKKANLNPRDRKDSFSGLLSYHDIRQNNEEPKIWLQLMLRILQRELESLENCNFIRILQGTQLSAMNIVYPGSTDLSELKYTQVPL